MADRTGGRVRGVGGPKDDRSSAKPKPAEPAESGYVRVTSPMGSVTDVPQSVLDALLASGYTR